MSTDQTQNASELRNEKLELYELQERMLLQMSKQNELRERELKQLEEHDAIIKEQTLKEIERTKAEKEKTIELSIQNDHEKRRLHLMEQLLNDIQQTLVLLPKLALTIDQQTNILYTLTELQKLIIPRLMKEGDEQQISRLSEILKAFGQRDITVTGTNFGDMSSQGNIDMTVVEAGESAQIKK